MQRKKEVVVLQESILFYKIDNFNLLVDKLNNGC